MEIFTVKDLSFSYPETNNKALDDISFSMSKGEFITLCGFSGSGKSTLLRHLKPAITPYGQKSGQILFMGEAIESISEKTLAKKIGYVMQSPDNQTITDKVWHELAFGLESLGYDRDEIKRRSAEIVSFFGIGAWYHKKISELSGGQRQILNLASVMITSPEILILDEPLSQLDPIAADEFLKLIVKINRELGTSVIISSHDIDKLFKYSHRMMFMTDGRIVSDASPSETAEFFHRSRSPFEQAVPLSARLFFHYEKAADEPPFDIKSGRDMLTVIAEKNTVHNISTDHKIYDKKTVPALSLKDVYFRYERSGSDILKGTELDVYGGEIFAVTGGNGSGKTTILKAMAGLTKIYSGSIKVYGRKFNKNTNIGYLPQAPETLFVHETVMEELEENTDKDDKYLEDVIHLCGLEKLLDRHPYDLSGGEQQRAALAKVLLNRPDVILLDEPVKGMDIKAKTKTGSILKKLARQGKCIVFVSHDMDFCAGYADRCAMMFDGQLIGISGVHEFFTGNHFYTTGARRLTSGIIEGCVTDEDVYAALNIETNKLPDEDDDPENKFDITDHPSKKKCSDFSITPIKVKKKNMFLTLLTVFLLIPATIFSGIVFLNDTKYLFISLLIMLECTVPFFLRFEHRKIKTREIVLIAAMTALCVASRTVFYMFPEFKPLTAVVILSGVSLGAESGFMIGSLSMLCSNIIFGQGPWTPWQMFAMGLTGLISGLIFSGGRFRVNKAGLAVFGGFCALIIYGGIMDPAAAIMSHIEINIGTLAAYYAAGLPLDLIHAASTSFFLIIGTDSIIKKLERIKKKYGIAAQSL